MALKSTENAKKGTRYCLPYDMCDFLNGWRKWLDFHANERGIDPYSWNNLPCTEKAKRIVLIVVTILLAISVAVVHQYSQPNNGSMFISIAILGVGTLVVAYCLARLFRKDEPRDYRKYGNNQLIVVWLEQYMEDHDMNSADDPTKIIGQLESFHCDVTAKSQSFTSLILTAVSSTFVAFLVSLLINVSALSGYNTYIMTIVLFALLMLGLIILFVIQVISAFPKDRRAAKRRSTYDCF